MPSSSPASGCRARRRRCCCASRPLPICKRNAMPAGVALHSVHQETAMVRLQGHAVSQDKVAALLLALEQTAPWSRPEVIEVRGAAEGAVEWTIRLALAP